MSETNLDLFSRRRLPPRPNLEYLKNEAKRRLHALRGKEPGARLADVQHQLAREYGFANWRELKAGVERASALPTAASATRGRGDWIAALPGDNRIALHLRPDDDEVVATVDTPDLGFFGMVADDVVVDDERLSFTLLVPLTTGQQQGFYEAHWDAEIQGWRGAWTAQGVTTHLDFRPGAYPPSASFEGLDGFWDSRLESSTGLIRLIVRFKTSRHGTHAWMDSPDRNLIGRPAVSIERRGQEVTVTMRTIKIVGTLSEDGQWIEGRLTKGEVETPVTFVRRQPGAIAPMPQRAPAIDVPADILARYVGCYVTNLGTLVNVTLEGGRLHTQSSYADRRSGDSAGFGPKLDMLASSPTRFFWRIMDASVEFELNPEGAVTGYVLRQNGRTSRGRRLD